MIYVMSDIHGEYEKYLEMLEKINFSDSDELYVLGDVVDRGNGSVKILKDMSVRWNVFPLMGNHDYMASVLLRRFNTQITNENADSYLNTEIMSLLNSWLSDGGETTLAEFKKLTPDDRDALIEYMEEFELYAEVSAGGKNFVLVHAGLGDFDPDRALEDYTVDQLVFDRLDYTQRYFKDKYLVTGHTPTALISPEYRGRIFQMNGHIAIDCGATFGLKLGCLRLDDMQEFYV